MHTGKQYRIENFSQFELTRLARWGIVPVVKVAQRESCISLPEELIVPWDYLQNHFGCTSHSGNVMSGLLLNFDGHGRHIFKANTGLSEVVMSAEEEFARIFRDIETSVRLFAFILHHTSFSFSPDTGPPNLPCHDSRNYCLLRR